MSALVKRALHLPWGAATTQDLSVRNTGTVPATLLPGAVRQLHGQG